MQQPIKATPLTPAEMAPILVNAFRAEYQRDPTRPEARWLLALARHENANGRAIIRHNWGNRIAVGREDFWVPRWADSTIAREKLSKAEQATRDRFLAGDAVPGRFAAYPSHETGARKFVRLFQSTTHQRILKAAGQDDAEAFWRAIWTPHPKTRMVYCVECGNEKVRQTYQKLALNSDQFFRDLDPGKPPTSSGGVAGLLLVVVGVTMASFLSRWRA